MAHGRGMRGSYRLPVHGDEHARLEIKVERLEALRRLVTAALGLQTVKGVVGFGV